MISRINPPAQTTMRIISLQSGSNGNCIYVETQNTRLLFDAGISGVRAKDRLAAHGLDICDVDGLFISHDHWDHAGNMGVYNRKFDIPVWVTETTHKTAAAKKSLGKISSLNHFASGEAIKFGDVTIETICTPHDASDGVAFIVDNGRVRFGIMTDLGHVFNDLKESVKSLDAVLLESNYDPHELKYCDYTDETKARIRGKGGHISNMESARLIDSAKSRLRWACLGHISEESNHPQLVRETHFQLLQDAIPLHIASRYEVSEIYTL